MCKLENKSMYTVRTYCKNLCQKLVSGTILKRCQAPFCWKGDPNMEGFEFKRKLTVTGSGKSYYLTLPREIIKELGWKKGEFKVVIKDKNTIVIKDWAND